MGHKPASVGRGWEPEILSPTRARGSREKKCYTGDSVGQTKQAIHDSGGGRGVSNQVNEFVHYEL